MAAKLTLSANKNVAINHEEDVARHAHESNAQDQELGEPGWKRESGRPKRTKRKTVVVPSVPQSGQ